MEKYFFKNTLLICAISLSAVFSACNSETEEQISTEETHLQDSDFSVLVFSKTAGFRHSSIEAGTEAIKKLGTEHNFDVTATEDSELFTDENLAGYQAVLFLNTTQTVLNDSQKEAFTNFIGNGGGFVGVHSAADTEYDWPWYNLLVGAYFESHPAVQPAVIRVEDRSHPSTEMLPEEWEKVDEWYNYSDFNEDVNVLMKLDTDSYDGSEMPGDHPIAWYHEYEGGRAFYTGLGHTEESYSQPLFLDHLLGGIRYAAGAE